MTILDKTYKIDSRLKAKSPSLESFEETYKTAYTHGLEAIYSLENVDVKTIRKIEENAPASLASHQADSIETPVQEMTGQLEFDFGDSFREWIEPFFLHEPIQVLGLSSQAENCLLDHGMKRVADLVTHSSKDYVFLKGMGQGHIDDVQKKMTRFIAGRSLKCASTIDFRSLLMSISKGISFKKFSLLLQDYCLGDIVPLSPADKIELKAFKLSKDEAWRKELREILSERSRHGETMEFLEKITKAFIIPWMQKRGGVAREEEIVERLERVSEQPAKTASFLAFLTEQFTEGKFPFATYLCEPEKGVFCCNQQVLLAYRTVLDTARTYFYRPHISYGLEHLKNLLSVEFAKGWKDFPKILIEGCLKRSSFFTIRKIPSGNLEIMLA